MSLGRARILVTGGTGTFGRAFVKRVLATNPDIERLVIFSRDEFKQYEMSQTFSEHDYPGIRYFIGDVRDKERLALACENIDVIVHAAALKHVPTGELNPFEVVKTNIGGADNVIAAALSNEVSKVIALSTDKAAGPVNLYGATKLCSDKFFVAANNIRRNLNPSFSVVRYGNVMNSRGSVIPFFLSEREKGVLPITHTDMTRFNISIEEGVDHVIWAIENAFGGEIFVPKLPSYRVVDLAKAIAPSARHEIVGIRPGEKIHEDLLLASEAGITLEMPERYVAIADEEFRSRFANAFQATAVEGNFQYNSGTNNQFLSVGELHALIFEKEMNPA